MKTSAIRQIQNSQWNAMQNGEVKIKTHKMADRVAPSISRRLAREEALEIKQATQEVWDE